MLTNLIKGKSSRRKPVRGDIFAFQLEQLPARFHFGRVIATDTNIGNMPGMVVLIYIYKATSPEKTRVPLLVPSELLVAPIGTNALLWTRGFFECVAVEAVRPEDLLQQHCFLRPSFIGRAPAYVDEYGHRLDSATEPVGFFGLSGLLAVDDEISDALGIPVKVR